MTTSFSVESLILNGGIALVTALLTFFAATRKSSDSKEVEFRDQTLQLAQTLQQNLMVEMEIVKAENKKLQERVRELEKQLSTLQSSQAPKLARVV